MSIYDACELAYKNGYSDGFIGNVREESLNEDINHAYKMGYIAGEKMANLKNSDEKS